MDKIEIALKDKEWAKFEEKCIKHLEEIGATESTGDLYNIIEVVLNNLEKEGKVFITI